MRVLCSTEHLVDICNAAKIMVFGKGSSLAVGLFFNNKARVESLGTALASTTLQAKPPWARVMAKQVPQCIC